MHIGKVEALIRETAERDGVVFFGLIDPKENIESGVRFAKAFYEGGADIILLGGSLGVGQTTLDELAVRIKEGISIPLMLFPGNINGVTRHADALYFMSLLNSENPYWITGAQALAAPEIARMGIEAIPTSFIIIEPGETVGFVGQARPVLRHKPEIAAAFALAGKLMGQRVTILECGSGAPGPAPPEMFKAVKAAVGHPVICAGSCRNMQEMEATIKAGADGIHIASLIENAADPRKEAKRIIDFCKRAGKAKK